MHNNIMAAGPYQLSTVIVLGQPATDDSLEVPARTAVETLLNISPKNNAHYESEKEAIHLLLTGIGDEIYSTVDACKTAHEIKIKSWTKEVNDIRAERIAKNANPLALVAAAQQYPQTYYQEPKPQRSYAPSSKQSSSTRSHIPTKHKGKEIAKQIIPPSESGSKEDSDPEQAQKDKDMQKNLALIAKYFKKLYKPTNNNPRTSSNSKNKNEDTTLRYINEKQSAQFRNQRTITITRARDTVGSQAVHQTGKQCFNCKEFSHFAKECRKPKRVKDYTYHKKKMLLCKQTKKGVPLQEILPVDSGSDVEPLEKDDSNVIPDSSNMCDIDNNASTSMTKLLCLQDAYKLLNHIP
ncbi:retrovirus-related pol polyprotein from transposon TNT 1-94 [Tanacetum coccineum]